MATHITEKEEVQIKTQLMNFIKENFVFEGTPEATKEMLYDKTDALFEIVMLISDKTPYSENGGLDKGDEFGGVPVPAH